ncbi:hypothetical protein BV25DRAFT_1578023 [Artomyces pyxidatus]|uniref:Uncharacterized protein n=1 Tax=Artomyces pyxidatus TaxID=48021 RepID=A0ACB8SJP9_9AGAM|nr:hypothetical protein BV25DRAFT_1578023 [Artomyces pyxidatus]
MWRHVAAIPVCLPRRTNIVFLPRSARPFSSSSVEESKTPSSYGRIIVRTLDPKRLQREDFVNLSFRFKRRYVVPSISSEVGSFLAYAHPRSTSSNRFPAGTCGFFYYHPPDSPDAVVGHLRFRVTSSDDPAAFATGSDLKTPDGLPWHMPPSHMGLGRRKANQALGQLLLAEKLVTPARIDLWNKHPQGHTASILMHFDDPFPMDFSRTNHYCWILSTHVPTKWRFNNKTFRRIRNVHAYGPTLLGKGLVRWEMSTLPIHAGKPVLVLRLVKALTEFTVVPGWEDRVAVPREGELLLHTKKRLWALDLNGKKYRSTRSMLQTFLPSYDWSSSKNSGDNDK